MKEEILNYLIGSPKELYYLIIGLSVLLPIIATVKVLKSLRGVEVPAWCLFIWFFPFIGSIIAIIYDNNLNIEASTQPTKNLSDFEQFLQEDPSRKFLSKKDQKEVFERWLENSK